MKRPFSILAILAFGSAILQASPQLYDITLSTAERFTQCRIAYSTGSSVKFTGTDKNGKTVTKTVKKSSILVQREVKTIVKKTEEDKPEAEETPATPEPETKEAEATEAPAEEDTDAPAAEETDAEQAEEPKEATPAASEPDGASARERTYDKLSARITELNKKKAEIADPSRNFESRYSAALKTINRALEKMEKDCSEVDSMQAEFDSMTGQGYTYEIVAEQDRLKYGVDGKAAYDAMVVDMNQKRNSRKIGGLDKFEVLRESFQGIPEYPEAYSWYIKTLKTLDKKWEKSIAGINKKREKMSDDKREKLEAKDEAEYEKLEKQLEEDGEHIAQVWYTPRPQNLVMLKAAKNKVEDVLRRSEHNKPLPQTGKVISLINAFWASMDKARDLMVAGSYDEAKEEMENNEEFKTISRLNKNLLPEEYKSPLIKQREAMYSELKKRISNRKTLQRTLDSKRAALSRTAESTENQVDRLADMLDRELEKQASDAAEEAEEAAAEEAEAEGDAEETAEATEE